MAGQSRSTNCAHSVSTTTVGRRGGPVRVIDRGDVGFPQYGRLDYAEHPIVTADLGTCFGQLAQTASDECR